MASSPGSSSSGGPSGCRKASANASSTTMLSTRLIRLASTDDSGRNSRGKYTRRIRLPFPTIVMLAVERAMLNAFHGSIPLRRKIG